MRLLFSNVNRKSDPSGHRQFCSISVYLRRANRYHCSELIWLALRIMQSRVTYIAVDQNRVEWQRSFKLLQRLSGCIDYGCMTVLINCCIRVSKVILLQQGLCWNSTHERDFVNAMERCWPPLSRQRHQPPCWEPCWIMNGSVGFGNKSELHYSELEEM